MFFLIFNFIIIVLYKILKGWPLVFGNKIPGLSQVFKLIYIFFDVYFIFFPTILTAYSSIVKGR